MINTTKSVDSTRILARANLLNETLHANWQGITFEYKKSLEIDEAIGFFESVMAGCVDGTANVFRVELLDFSFRSNVISFYTNIELPQKAELQYKLLFWTDLYSEVKSKLNAGQIASLEEAVWRAAN